jgi:formylglycine-generating enzyme required for sulfatase activity
VTVALPKAGGGVGSESRFWTRPRTGIAAGAAVLLVAGVVTVTLLLDGKTEDPIPLARQVETSTGTMFLVPAGPFLAGEQKQAVTLADFYIDQTEVTNAAYSEFCKASGRKLPEDFAADKGGHPVVNVSYRDAEAFAGWAGKRLPTSLEWEKAARGSEGSLFPWGDAVDPARANVRDNPDPKYAGALAPVTAFPLSASPFGPLNLVGNAWEFVNERGEPTPKDFDTFREAVPNLSNQSRWVKIRGGSFGENLDRTAGWNSASVPADLRNHLIGFRCVRDPAPSDRSGSESGSGAAQKSS